jgi:hypothetical protein
MDINFETIIKIIIVIILLNCLFGSSNEGFKRIRSDDTLGLSQQHIRMRQNAELPGSLPQRIRRGFTDSQMAVESFQMPGDPVPPMHIMSSQYVKNHIRANRRNNMLYSMMDPSIGSGPDTPTM